MPQALFSVFDKAGLVDLARRLSALGWNLLASGGTAKALRAAGLDVEEIADYTGAPEILGGRVKTLHPAIHGGILARSSAKDLEDIKSLGYRAVDMVVVNLYPFEKTAAHPASSRDDIIEQIDIGGVALIRAAAKNHERVTILCDVEDYIPVVEEIETAGKVAESTRRALAAKAFALTSAYDTAIADWFSDGAVRPLRGYKVQTLRYGENPHQSAEIYSFEKGRGALGGRVLQGKELSYNNILDLDAAWQAAGRFERPAVVVVKHLSPCGIAESTVADPSTLPAALEKAIACDPISAFGGVIATNAPFSAACVDSLGTLFAECIAAPAFDEDALAMLANKKNLRLVIPGEGAQRDEIRTVLGGFLRQDIDAGDPVGVAWRVVSKRPPTASELRDLEFAWKACMSVKSNAIVFAKDGATVGIGGGQPNRVDSVRIAAQRAGKKSQGAVLASDAFFPFPDSIEEAAKAGITAVVHPGGSMRDGESIEAADRAGMAMLVTGARHFRH